MELTLNEAQAKALLKEVVIELIREKRELFSEIIVEAIEDIGLGNAIREGRKGDFVDETEITAILEGRV